jgi:hypothetical protein
MQIRAQFLFCTNSWRSTQASPIRVSLLDRCHGAIPPMMDAQGHGNF